ncbi:MAG: protein kinase, partial [Actinobacteria bacterium]|nr:protein kinase [Actinomycetota bacterium]
MVGIPPGRHGVRSHGFASLGSLSMLADAVLSAHGEYSPCSPALLSTAVESNEGNDVPLIDGFVNLVQVGQGGFSVVYSADEIAFTRRVALKVLKFTGDEARRLEREARALGVLSDIPNIVQVFQITHTNDGRSVLVMALMQEPIARETRRGFQQQLDALVWLDQVAQALDKAHLRGVYHRDIKPENILLAADGSANLVDFGIAGLGGLASGTTTAFSFSPPFAPPERLTGTEVDLRAGDIYSLGSTFYAVFTGSAPFGTTTDGGVHGLITRVVTALPDQPEWMNAPTHAAFLTAMAKDPADRFASASEFAAELRRGIS